MPDQPQPSTSTPSDEPVPAPTRVEPDNPIGSLYNLAKGRKLHPPDFKLLKTSGPNHHLTFVLACSFMDRQTTGSGHTYKAAKLAAAISMISTIGVNGLPPKLQRAKKSIGPKFPTRHTLFTLILYFT
jgi:hypothetical protein